MTWDVPNFVALPVGILVSVLVSVAVAIYQPRLVSFYENRSLRKTSKNKKVAQEEFALIMRYKDDCGSLVAAIGSSVLRAIALISAQMLLAVLQLAVWNLYLSKPQVETNEFKIALLALFVGVIGQFVGLTAIMLELASATWTSTRLMYFSYYQEQFEAKWGSGSRVSPTTERTKT